MSIPTVTDVGSNKRQKIQNSSEMCVLCEGRLIKSLQKLRTSCPEVVWQCWTRPSVGGKQEWAQRSENVAQGNCLYLGRVLIWDWYLFLSYKPNFVPLKKIYLPLAAPVTIVWNLTFLYNMCLVLTWLLLVIFETVLFWLWGLSVRMRSSKDGSNYLVSFMTYSPILMSVSFSVSLYILHDQEYC